MTTSTIPVYILTADSNSVRAIKTRNLFGNPFFDPVFVNVDASGVLTDVEGFRIRRILNYAQENNQDKIVIIQDTSVTRESPEGIANLIRDIITDDQSAAIVYLSTWQESCESLDKSRSLPDRSTVIARGRTPHGLQAILLNREGQTTLLGMNDTPRGLADALSEAVEARTVVADVVFPPLFSFDILNAPDKNERGNMCAPRKVPQTLSPGNILPTKLSEVIQQSVAQGMQRYERAHDEYTGVSPAVVFFILIVIAAIAFAVWWWFFRENNFQKINLVNPKLEST
jgi:hypothetical protein